MNLKTVLQNDIWEIAIEGDLDASSALELDNAIKQALEQNAQKLVINCRELNYVSSAGLGVFISYLSEFQAKNIWFALMQVNAKIMETLNVLGLTSLLQFIDELPNA